MGSSSKRRHTKERVRAIPRQGCRQAEESLVVLNAHRRARHQHSTRARPQVGCGRGHSNRQLRTNILEQVKLFQDATKGDDEYSAKVLFGFVSHCRMAMACNGASPRSKKDQATSDLVL